MTFCISNGLLFLWDFSDAAGKEDCDQWLPRLLKSTIWWFFCSAILCGPCFRVFNNESWNLVCSLFRTCQISFLVLFELSVVVWCHVCFPGIIVGIFLYPTGGVLEPPVICSEPLCFSFISCSEQRKWEDLFSPLVVFIMRLFGLFIVFWLISGLEDLRPTANSPEKLSWTKVLQVDVMVRATIPEFYSLG